MATDVEAELSTAELRELSNVAGTMIPASAEWHMPGADDPTILADIARSIGRDLPLVREALSEIATKSNGAFTKLDHGRRETLIVDWYATGGAAAAALARVIAGAYYRDDRVLLALGLEARAPYPKSHVLEQGDWLLLDTVRKRPAFWRDDRVAEKG
jgi:hypothetical protein